MLNTLRKIVQEVNAAKDLKAALGIIVQRVKEAMGSQVCSVYLLDPETNRYVLMATDGLNKRAIGKVSMSPNEGLVGLVGSREEPLNLEHASEHPRYRYFAETGEERFMDVMTQVGGRAVALGWQAWAGERLLRLRPRPEPVATTLRLRGSRLKMEE